MIFRIQVVQIFQFAVLSLLTIVWALPAGAASTLTSSDGLHPDGYSLPGLRAAGYPNFETDVSVRWRQLGNAGYLLHVKGTDSSSLLNMSPIQEHSISKTKFHLLARLDANGNTIAGNMLITGGIDDLGIRGGLLMRAGLEEFNHSENLLGFNTSDIMCPWFDFCTQNESVYISLADTFSMDQQQFISTGLAVTTVPLPAAAWLLAGGLVGLVGAGAAKKRTRSKH